MIDRTKVVQRIITDSSNTIKISLQHIPTGITVKGETNGSRMKLLNSLLSLLEKQIMDKERKEPIKKVNNVPL